MFEYFQFLPTATDYMGDKAYYFIVLNCFYFFYNLFILSPSPRRDRVVVLYVRFGAQDNGFDPRVANEILSRGWRRMQAGR